MKHVTLLIGPFVNRTSDEVVELCRDAVGQGLGEPEFNLDFRSPLKAGDGVIPNLDLLVMIDGDVHMSDRERVSYEHAIADRLNEKFVTPSIRIRVAITVAPSKLSIGDLNGDIRQRLAAQVLGSAAGKAAGVRVAGE